MRHKGTSIVQDRLSSAPQVVREISCRLAQPQGLLALAPCETIANHVYLATF